MVSEKLWNVIIICTSIWTGAWSRFSAYRKIWNLPTDNLHLIVSEGLKYCLFTSTGCLSTFVFCFWFNMSWLKRDRYICSLRPKDNRWTCGLECRRCIETFSTSFSLSLSLIQSCCCPPAMLTATQLEVNHNGLHTIWLSVGTWIYIE